MRIGVFATSHKCLIRLISSVNNGHIARRKFPYFGATCFNDTTYCPARETHQCWCTWRSLWRDANGQETMHADPIHVTWIHPSLLGNYWEPSQFLVDNFELWRHGFCTTYNPIMNWNYDHAKLCHISRAQLSRSRIKIRNCVRWHWYQQEHRWVF